jgi:hypothetical protein
MKKAALFATILALALGASAQTVGPTAPIHVVDPLKGGKGGKAVIDPGSVARSSENTIADAGTVMPPIIILGPTAPKKSGPVARESENTIAGAGTVKPPIIVISPTAPKKQGPVAHEVDNTIAGDRSVVKPPIAITGPTAPKKSGPVAHELESANA